MRDGGFDVIIGNPPYLDSEEMTKPTRMREYYATSRLYDSAQGNWDIFCLFLERGLQLLRDGGFLGMIVPNKLLSADYAAVIRSIIARYKIVAIRDYSTIPVFSASVYPIVIIVKKE
jgi:methylase of polypeptide subunit release factors